MTDKLLSQDEISALLQTVSPDKGDGESSQDSKAQKKRGGGSSSIAEDEGHLFPLSKVRSLGKEVESALLLVMDAFSHKTAATLSTTLRTHVSFQIHDFEQVLYGDFLESLPEPSSMWYLGLKPHDLHLALCLEPSLVSIFMSVMLGGGNLELGGDKRQNVTELEQSIVETVVENFCKELRHAWSRVSEVEIEIDNRETRPRLLRIYPPGETMVVVGMVMKVNTWEGGLYWGVPGSLLDTLDQTLSHERKVDSREQVVGLVERLRTLSGRFPTRLEAQLQETPVRLEELLTLEVGDVLKTEHLVNEPVQVKLNGKRKMSGQLLLSNDRKAVRIESRQVKDGRYEKAS